MVNRFESHLSRQPARAIQAWIILVGHATRRQTLTYSDLNHMVNFSNPRNLNRILEYIMRFCNKHGLPSLTSIVVSKSTGVPGEGLPDFDPAHHERVFQYDWYGIFPPTIEELIALEDEA